MLDLVTNSKCRKVVLESCVFMGVQYSLSNVPAWTWTDPDWSLPPLLWQGDLEQITYLIKPWLICAWREVIPLSLGYDEGLNQINYRTSLAWGLYNKYSVPDNHCNSLINTMNKIRIYWMLVMFHILYYRLWNIYCTMNWD